MQLPNAILSQQRPPPVWGDVKGPSAAPEGVQIEKQAPYDGAGNGGPPPDGHGAPKGRIIRSSDRKGGASDGKVCSAFSWASFSRRRGTGAKHVPAGPIARAHTFGLQCREPVRARLCQRPAILQRCLRRARAVGELRNRRVHHVLLQPLQCLYSDAELRRPQERLQLVFKCDRPRTRLPGPRPRRAES